MDSISWQDLVFPMSVCSKVLSALQGGSGSGTHIYCTCPACTGMNIEGYCFGIQTPVYSSKVLSLAVHLVTLSRSWQFALPETWAHRPAAQGLWRDACSLGWQGVSSGVAILPADGCSLRITRIGCVMIRRRRAICNALRLEISTYRQKNSEKFRGNF